MRGRKILAYINKHLGNSRGIKTIEVGSGLGVYSFIFALRGVEAALMDYSQEALSLAEENFIAGGLSFFSVFRRFIRHIRTEGAV